MCHNDVGFRQFHPYAIKLQELFDKAGVNVTVHERGVSGERVVEEMETRLPRLLEAAQAHGMQFEWVVILGGINDIGRGTDHGRVFRGLQLLYSACREHGARVLALTCLETAYGQAWPERDTPRQELNKRIRSEAAQTDFITLLDTDRLLPYPRDPAADPAAAALWDDGLHLTPQGYDELGRLVFEALRGRLQQQ